MVEQEQTRGLGFLLSDTLYPNGRGGTDSRPGFWLTNKSTDLSACNSEECEHEGGTWVRMGDACVSVLCVWDVVCVTEVVRHPWRPADFSMSLDDLVHRSCLVITTIFILLLSGTTRVTEKTDKWVSVWWKTKNPKMRDLHVSDTLGILFIIMNNR